MTIPLITHIIESVVESYNGKTKIVRVVADVGVAGLVVMVGAPVVSTIGGSDDVIVEMIHSNSLLVKLLRVIFSLFLIVKIKFLKLGV